MTPTTMQEAIDRAIATAARDIVELVSMGWNEQAATAHVRKATTFGPKGWEQVLAKVARLQQIKAEQNAECWA
jgi:hypothetical protein